MSSLLFSYRRSDSGAVAGRIAERLRDAFGEASLDYTGDDSPPGISYREAIHDRLVDTDVVLVIIGPSWAADGRLYSDDDPVRLEVEQALSMPGKAVIPVLVEGAQLPDSATLPESLRPLANHSAVVIRDDPDFHQDVSQLSEFLGQYMGVGRAKRKSKGASTDSDAEAAQGSRALILAALVLVLGIGAAAMFWVMPVDAPDYSGLSFSGSVNFSNPTPDPIPYHYFTLDHPGHYQLTFDVAAPDPNCGLWWFIRGESPGASVVLPDVNRWVIGASTSTVTFEAATSGEFRLQVGPVIQGQCAGMQLYDVRVEPAA